MARLRVSNSILIVVVVLLTLWIALQQVLPHVNQVAAQPRVAAERKELTDDENRTIAIYEEALPSVVFVTGKRVVRNFFSNEVQTGTGTGFVWDSHGHIVTNLHVILGHSALAVRLSDQSVHDATLVGYSRRHDLAVLRIDPSEPEEQLRPLPLGTSDDLQVGQSVFAIGNPFGFDQTLTTGIISALDRDIRGQDNVLLRSMIQTDAAINPGNSGGPLLDSGGRIIGVNTAIVSPSQASAGIGFSVPIDVVNLVVPQLINYGREITPEIRISVRPTQKLRTRLRVHGLAVRTVQPGSTAEASGLRGWTDVDYNRVILGDIIIAVDGKRVVDLQGYRSAIQDKEVGDTVVLDVLRLDQEGERTIKIPVVLEGVRPDR